MVCLIAALLCVIFSPNAVSIQYSMQSDVMTQAGYNDNIFVTILPHNSVSNFSVTPSVKLNVKDRNWDAYLNGRVRNNNYSDHNFDTNDIFLDMSSNYSQERNIYILSGNYNKDSNLNLETTNFGVTGDRVKRKLWGITPQYQRSLTERLIFSASFNHSAVNYVDPATTGAVSYSTNTLSTALRYGLTEMDKLSLDQQTSDYASKDNSFKYRLSVLSIGLEHNFSELWAMNFSIGASKRSSTSTSNIPFYFFGQPVVYTQVSDFTNRGKVFNFGLTKKLEAGSFATTINRNDEASSYGGLSEVDALKFKFDHKITSIWRYNVLAQYEKTKSVTSALNATNYETLNFTQNVSYEIDRHWSASGSYRYLQRKFTGSVVDNKVRHSNMIYFGITYNFPDISTY